MDNRGLLLWEQIKLHWFMYTRELGRYHIFELLDCEYRSTLHALGYHDSHTNSFHVTAVIETTW